MKTLNFSLGPDYSTTTRFQVCRTNPREVRPHNSPLCCLVKMQELATGSEGLGASTAPRSRLRTLGVPREERFQLSH
jgi:hypothetical protein